MGNWGHKILESDTADDWMTHLGSRDVSVITNALSEITETDRTEYLEADTCEEALAAAELLAAAGGLPTKGLPEAAQDWLQKEQPRVSAKLVKQARRVLARVRANSELKELWEEGKDGPKWHAELQALDARLSKLPNSKLAPKYDQPKKKPKKIKLEPGDVFAMPIGDNAYGVCKVLWFSKRVKFHMWIAIYDMVLQKPDMPVAFGDILKQCFSYPDTVTSDNPAALVPLKGFSLPGAIKVGSVKLSREEAAPPNYQSAGAVQVGDKWIRRLNYDDKSDPGFLLPDGNPVGGSHLRWDLQQLLLHHHWWADDSDAKRSKDFIRQIEKIIPKANEDPEYAPPGRWYIERYSPSGAIKRIKTWGWYSPLRYRNDEWKRFAAKLTDGRQLWWGHTGEHDKGKGRESFVIVQNGKVIAEYLLWRN